MGHLLVLFAHLLAACTAIGAIGATDLRLLRKLAAPRARIAPPNRFVVRLVAGSLGALAASGAVLVGLGLQGDPTYLGNPKLQGKLLLVAALVANAAVLHRWTFPWLATGRRLSRWPAARRWGVAGSVAVSNGLWLYCAFLGIARPWNHTVPLGWVLGVGAAVCAAAWAGCLVLLSAAARGAPADPPDGLDRLKQRLAWIGGALGS